MRIKTRAVLFFSVMTAGIIFLASAQESGPQDKVKALNGYADEETVKNNIKPESNTSMTESASISQVQQSVAVVSPKNETMSSAKGRPGIYLYNLPYMSMLYVDDKYMGNAENYSNKSSPLYLDPGKHSVKLRGRDNVTFFEKDVTLEKDSGPVRVR